jgi:hypothetical protein
VLEIINEEGFSDFKVQLKARTTFFACEDHDNPFTNITPRTLISLTCSFQWNLFAALYVKAEIIVTERLAR